MRVAIEASWACGKPTGIGYYVRGLLEGLAQLNTDHEFYLLHWSREWTGGDYGKRFCPISYRRGTALTSILFGLNPALRKLGNIDCFHATAATGLPPRTILPCVATIHDLFRLEKNFPDSWLQKVKFRHMLNWSLRNASHLICNSHETAKAVTSLPRAKGKRVTVTHLAPATNNPFSENRFNSGQSPQSKPGYLLCLGGLEPRKGQVFLVDAYACLKKRRPGTPPLVFAGPDRGDGDEVQEQIKKHHLETNISWKGYVSECEKADLLKGACALLMPSRQEGFGLPILEAMQAGIPVIASDLPIFREIAGKAACLIDSWVAEKWADKIAEVLMDQSHLNRLVADGLSQVKEYTWEKCAQQTMEVYQKVIAGSRLSHA